MVREMRMLRVFLSGSVALLLAGCATAPQTFHMTMHRAPVVKSAPVLVAPIAPATPNQTVKKRWYDHFPKHPKWFHHQ